MNIIKLNLFDQELVINFPTIGQMMEIEMKKIVLSNDKYGSLIKNRTIQSTFMLDLIDAFAYFSTLCPEFTKILEAKNMDIPEKLDYKTGKMIVNAYTKTFWPWYDGVMKSIDSEFEKTQKDKEQTIKADADKG